MLTFENKQNVQLNIYVIYLKTKKFKGNFETNHITSENTEEQI